MVVGCIVPVCRTMSDSNKIESFMSAWLASAAKHFSKWRADYKWLVLGNRGFGCCICADAGLSGVWAQGRARMARPHRSHLSEHAASKSHRLADPNESEMHQRVDPCSIYVLRTL